MTYGYDISQGTLFFVSCIDNIAKNVLASIILCTDDIIKCHECEFKYNSLLIRSCAFIRYWQGNGCVGTVYQLFTDLKNVDMLHKKCCTTFSLSLVCP
jgi:hypothetical protein